MMERRTWLRHVGAATVAMAVGCADVGEPPIEPLVALQVDLSEISIEEDPAVGVTFADGAIHVLTKWGSLFRLEDESFSLVHEIDIRQAPFGFTDIVSLPGNTFALTSQSDGFILDLDDKSLTQHFCFEPGWEEPVQGEPRMIQTSYAVTYAGGLIYAQPHTSQEDTPERIEASFYATYDFETGSDLSWYESSPRLVGGMAHFVDGDSEAILTGYRDELSVVTLHDDIGRVQREWLGTLGIDAPVDIQGLAVDQSTDSLVFIDANSNQLRLLPLRETIENARVERRQNEPVGS